MKYTNVFQSAHRVHPLLDSSFFAYPVNNLFSIKQNHITRKLKPLPDEAISISIVPL